MRCEQFQWNRSGGTARYTGKRGYKVDQDRVVQSLRGCVRGESVGLFVRVVGEVITDRSKPVQ